MPARNWENNGVVPRPNMLAQIAQAFGVSIEFMTTGVAEAPQLTTSAASTMADEILEVARKQLGKLIGVSPDRVKLSFQVATD